MVYCNSHFFFTHSVYSIAFYLIAYLIFLHFLDWFPGLVQLRSDIKKDRLTQQYHLTKEFAISSLINMVLNLTLLCYRMFWYFSGHLDIFNGALFDFSLDYSTLPVSILFGRALFVLAVFLNIYMVYVIWILVYYRNTGTKYPLVALAVKGVSAIGGLI
jgi:hypothetical protein